MEVFLNLAWVAISTALGVQFLVSRRRRGVAQERPVHSCRTASLAYVILIALLLPAISMTDDLMTMVAPTDGEQIARRYEAPAAGPHHAVAPLQLFHTGRLASTAPLEPAGSLPIAPDPAAASFPPLMRGRGRAPPLAG